MRTVTVKEWWEATNEVDPFVIVDDRRERPFREVWEHLFGTNHSSTSKVISFDQHVAQFYEYEERAAIAEHDGELNRSDAEFQAAEIIQFEHHMRRKQSR